MPQTTHDQMTKEERKAACIDDNLIRYSTDLEGTFYAIMALDIALGQL